jgi:hypothetical protein
MPTAPTQNGGTKSSGEKIGGNEDKKQAAKKSSSANTKKSSSWLGGIFGKFVGSSNQVHLPDDSDKKIVFDEKLGRWVNLDGDQDDLAPAAPPPMDPSFASGVPAASPGGVSGPTTPSGLSPTGFRAQPGKRRGRGYVDVFSQAGATKPVPVSPMMLVDPMAPPSNSSGGGIGTAGLAPPLPAIFNPTLTAHSNDDIPSSVMPGYALPSAADEVANSSEGPASMPMMFNPSYMTTVAAPPAF